MMTITMVNWAQLIWMLAMMVGLIGVIMTLKMHSRLFEARQRWLTALSRDLPHIKAPSVAMAFTPVSKSSPTFKGMVSVAGSGGGPGTRMPMPAPGAPFTVLFGGQSEPVQVSDFDSGRNGMRSEAEVRQMIAEIEAIRRGGFNGRDMGTADAVIAALQNVLTGPVRANPCACLGPMDLCRCQIRQLGLKHDGEDG